MPKKLFTSLIKCENCGYNYRYQKDRNTPKYLCLGYSTGKGCKIRYAIKEEEILYLIQLFCNRNNLEIEMTNKFMKKIIKQIYINSENQSIRIEFNNGEISEISPQKFII